MMTRSSSMVKLHHQKPGTVKTYTFPSTYNNGRTLSNVSKALSVKIIPVNKGYKPKTTTVIPYILSHVASTASKSLFTPGENNFFPNCKTCKTDNELT